MTIKVKFQILRCFGSKTSTLLLPGVNKVCDRCGGTGKHVNPSIDSHGISPEEFNEDPDFRESYFSGVYDITCEACAGEKVVGVVATEKLPPALRKRVAEQIAYDAWDRAEGARERAMGY